MNGHQNVAFSHLIGALKSPRNLNGYGADYAYKKKAENGIGGVGEEYSIIKKEIQDGMTNKFIPILREGTKEKSLTQEFKKLAFVDFTNDNDYIEKLEMLVISILCDSQIVE